MFHTLCCISCCDYKYNFVILYVYLMHTCVCVELYSMGFLNLCILVQCILCPRASLARTRMKLINHMMTSSSWSFFRVTGPLCGEFTGDRWIPLFDVDPLKPSNIPSNDRSFETTCRSCDFIVMIRMLFILVTTECNPLRTGDIIWPYNSR